MQNEQACWSLEDLIDFEHEAASSTGVSSSAQATVAAAIRGMEGMAARRTGLKAWLVELRSPGKSPGRRFTTLLGLIASALCLLTFISGSSAVLGLLDHEKGGINATLFIAILLGTQWLLLLVAVTGWMCRGKAAEGFSGFQTLLGHLARKLAGKKTNGWWQGLMDGGRNSRAAMLWRMARHAQMAGICFNLGILGGLAGLVMVRHVGFFWETTTDEAMREVLEKAVTLLSFPWAAWFSSAVPDSQTILASRWLPGHSTNLPPGPAAWWKFLLMATVVWGLLPRLILGMMARKGEAAALRKIDFQGRHHRVLWRAMTGTSRADAESPPLDGVLVLDVGGSGVSQQALRPYFLRHLRMHPTTWKNVAVLSQEAENEASAALAKAPAGIVLLAEAWALSPPRLTALHAQLRRTLGNATPIKFLAVNVTKAGLPLPATRQERQEWERFVDSLRDPLAEIHFYQDDQPAT